MPPESSVPRRAGFTGRCFVGPVFDYAWIGAAASLPVLALVLYGQSVPGLASVSHALSRLTDPSALPFVVLLFSSTHFAASTLRLYTKPGAVASLPFVSFGLPLLFLAILTLCVLGSGWLGRPFQALYLT